MQRYVQSARLHKGTEDDEDDDVPPPSKPKPPKS